MAYAKRSVLGKAGALSLRSLFDEVMGEDPKARPGSAASEPKSPTSTSSVSAFSVATPCRQVQFAEGTKTWDGGRPVKRVAKPMLSSREILDNLFDPSL